MTAFDHCVFIAEFQGWACKTTTSAFVGHLTPTDEANPKAWIEAFNPIRHSFIYFAARPQPASQVLIQTGRQPWSPRRIATRHSRLHF
jgi:hypothetical protein